MLTPGNGSPVVASLTVPVTVRGCAMTTLTFQHASSRLSPSMRESNVLMVPIRSNCLSKCKSFHLLWDRFQISTMGTGNAIPFLRDTLQLNRFSCNEPATFYTNFTKLYPPFLIRCLKQSPPPLALQGRRAISSSEVDLLISAGTLRGDQNHPVGAPGAVNRRGRRILQDRDRLDVVRVQKRD